MGPPWAASRAGGSRSGRVPPCCFISAINSARVLSAIGATIPPGAGTVPQHDTDVAGQRTKRRSGHVVMPRRRGEDTPIPSEPDSKFVQGDRETALKMVRSGLGKGCCGSVLSATC